MKILKRDKTEEEFQFEKIEKAVAKAFESCDVPLNKQVLKCLKKKYSGLNEDTVLDIEQIQDDVEDCLMSWCPPVAKKYIIYRYEHKAIREAKSKMEKAISKKLMGTDICNQNANLDEHSFGGKMGEATRIVTKDFALKNCMSRKSRRNHENNEIYIHDLDSFAVGEHNCLSVPFDELLSKGFNTRQTDVRPANSINTAFQLVAVLFQLQSLQQFGGVSATHLDWTMVPYVRKSFFKHFTDHYVEQCAIDENVDFTVLSDEQMKQYKKSKRKEFKLKYNIENEKWTIGDFSMDCINFHIDDERLKDINRGWYNSAYYETVNELKQAVEGMYHNLNTLQSRSGNQLPFTSINYGTCELAEGRLVIKALLNGSIEGVGKFHKTPIFPCGIFQMMTGVNRHEGDKNYDLYRLALKSTSLRLYPNYANVDWTGNAGYDKNNPRTYFSTMGCHAKDTKIIMADGSYKMVQDVAVGDKVMGINGSVRTVQSLIRGNDKLFEVNQSRGEKYIVNEGHVLALEYSASRKYRGLIKGDRVNMTVHEYLTLPKSMRRFFKGYKSGFELSEKTFDIPPYILGLWLGDGNSNGTRFSVNINEKQIIEDLAAYAASIGKKLKISKEKDEKCLSVDITNRENMNDGNAFRRALIKYGLMKNKHIPEFYFYGSYQQRSDLLAGLINTDGWAKNTKGSKTICFGNTNVNLIDGVKRLADSLGCTVTVIKSRGEAIGKGICEGSHLKPYYHVNIHDYYNNKLMPHKRNKNSASIRNFNTSTLSIREVGKGDFYGFELDGDKLYLINDCTVTHNCRTANGLDINALPNANPQMKDGRGNICPVTIIMPTLAMEADRDVEKFMKLLDKKIGEAKDMLIERFKWIASQSPSSAKFMWENGTMFGYNEKEGPISALKHGTLALGQLGLAETLQLLIGKNQTTEEGMELAKRIESLFQKRCAEYKNEYKLNFGVYYTPAENLCYTAMKKFKAKYGVIKNVSDREYFTNSIHVPVWEHMTPFEKIDIEDKLTGYSSAGCITYVELPSTTKHNLDALETVVNYAMDNDIPYFAVNLPNDMCRECGFTDEINDKCPKCGSSNISRLRRVTGYLSGDYKSSFNEGKQAEVADRVKHIREVK